MYNSHFSLIIWLNYSDFHVVINTTNAIAVSGHNAGETIYEASVIDAAGPLLTAVVKHALK